MHVLAGGDICFAPPFGNGDEEVLSVCDYALCINDHSRCVFAKLMPATRTAAQQRPHWESIKKPSESSIIVLSTGKVQKNRGKKINKQVLVLPLHIHTPL